MPAIIHAPDFAKLPGIRHGFYTAAWGHCGLSRTEAWNGDVLANRAAVASSLGVAPDRLLSCYQIHSPTVVTVTMPWSAADRPKADAMVTKEKNIALGILTADCVPVLFADPVAGVIGAAHAGWQGALGGVIEHTVTAMETLGASRRRIEAAIGPCIWQQSYEVGPEFPAPFLAEDAACQRFFRPSRRAGHFLFDLPRYAEAKLRAARINLFDPSPGDTCADAEPKTGRFFSYRRDTLNKAPRSGSLISVIVLTG